MIDQEMLEEFIIEAEEHLTEMEECLIRLEDEPHNGELLNDIFRAAHSLKGTAGLTGLIKINEVAHKMENLLEYLRQGKLTVSTSIVTTLFKGMDVINALVKGLSENGEEIYDIHVIVEKLDNIISGDVDDTIDGSGVGETSDEADEIVEQKTNEQEFSEENIDLLAQEEGTDFLSQEDEDSQFNTEEEFFYEEPTFIEQSDEVISAEIDNSEVDELEQLFIEQSKDKIQDISSIINESKQSDGTNDNFIQKIRNEIEDFQNIIEMSSHDDMLSPLQHMNEVLDLIYETGQSTDSEHIDDLTKDIEALKEKLDLISEQTISQSSDDEDFADRIEGEDIEYSEGEGTDLLEGKSIDHSEGESTVIQGYMLSIIDELREIKGLGPSKIQALCDAGLTENGDFLNIEEDELLQVKGITKKLAQKILEKLVLLGSYKKTEPAASEADSPHDEQDLLLCESSLDEDMSLSEQSSEEDDPVSEQPLDEDMTFTEQFDKEDESSTEIESQSKKIDVLCESLEQAIIDDEYDSELIDIFLNHMRKGYGELSSLLYDSSSEKENSEKIDGIYEIVTGLRKASNYMDFPMVTEFFTQWLDEIKEAKESFTEEKNYDFDFAKNRLTRIKVFLPDNTPEEKKEDISEEISSATLDVNADDAQTLEETPEQAIDNKKELSSHKSETEELPEKIHSTEDVIQEDNYEESPDTEALQEETSTEQNDLDNKLGDEPVLLSDGHEKKVLDNEKQLTSFNTEFPEQHDISSNTNEYKDSEQPQTEKKEPQVVVKEELSQVTEAKQTLRVDTQKVDSLMNQVGELVVNRALFSQLSEEIKIKIKQLLDIEGYDKKELKELINLNFRLGEATLSLGRVANDLQESVMKIRMLPISKLFNRYPRLVRELAIELSKKVELHIEGENTELDKRVIEQMADPLIHIIRNAIDHGIETPQERNKKKKAEAGVLILSSYYEGNHVVIRIDDDGKGIDSEKIQEKALSMGVITKAEAERLTEREMINLIFLPGMSTASEITRTSGRGVGMDVVKKNVEKLNGTIEVQSQEDSGTTFIIKIPLTLAINQVLLVRVAEQTYCIPLTSVIETVRIFEHDITTIEGHEVINIRDTTIPLIRLSAIFNQNGHEQSTDKTFVVIITTGHKEVGLVVDGLMGEQEVVIKPLGDYLCSHKGFSGATIMGDGSISLILDVSELVNMIIEGLKYQNYNCELEVSTPHSSVQQSLN